MLEKIRYKVDVKRHDALCEDFPRFLPLLLRHLHHIHPPLSAMNSWAWGAATPLSADEGRFER